MACLLEKLVSFNPRESGLCPSLAAASGRGTESVKKVLIKPPLDIPPSFSNVSGPFFFFFYFLLPEWPLKKHNHVLPDGSTTAQHVTRSLSLSLSL